VTNAHRVPVCEVREGNFLHGSSPPPVRQARVVYDATIANVDSMMLVECPGTDEMCRKGWLLTRE